jgi:putative DNA-invertase from lambdoid prophage Rac
MAHHTHVALYCRVSTKDQDCARQVHDLTQWAARMGATVVETFTETASGAKIDRALRASACEGVRKGRYTAILVTEPSRWSRSLIDLIETLNALARDGGSLLCLNGLSMDTATPTGKLMVSIMGGIAEFERDLIRERVHSGVAAAKRRGVKLGRKPGFTPPKKHDEAVMRLLATGMPVRDVASHLLISPTTVMAAKKRCATPN